LLLQQGADIYAVDFRKWTALHYAAYNGHSKAINFLMKWEADFDKLYPLKNTQNKTAFMISKNENVKKSFNRKSLVNYLSRHLESLQGGRPGHGEDHDPRGREQRHPDP
jgi:ankyrin repeat protein